MITPYEFGLKIGRFVKRADEYDDYIAEEIAEMSDQADQLDSAPGSNPNGNNWGTMAGRQLTTVNGQQQRLSPAQQAAVDAANKMKQENNSINAGAGGAGRGGRSTPAVSTPAVPTTGAGWWPSWLSGAPTPTGKPALPPTTGAGKPALPPTTTARTLTELPGGATASPDFGKAVE